MYRKPENTKLILESNGNKYTSELPWDVSADQLIESFYGMTIASSFHPLTILNCMKEFADNNLETLGFKNNKEE
jgi:hypothetical protein